MTGAPTPDGVCGTQSGRGVVRAAAGSREKCRAFFTLFNFEPARRLLRAARSGLAQELLYIDRRRVSPHTSQEPKYQPGAVFVGVIKMAKVQKSTDSSSLAEVVDRILDKGIVIDAWVKVSLVGIELLSIEARIVIASVETYLKYAEAIGLTSSAAAPA
jgi:hypothetical protein